jgi:signal transduction histidine kinase
LVIRRRPFLTCLTLLLVPLLLLALINYWLSLNSTEAAIQAGLHSELATFASMIDRIMDEQAVALRELAEANPTQHYASGNDESILNGRASADVVRNAGVGRTAETDLQARLSALLARGYFERIVLHDRNRVRFVAEPGIGTGTAVSITIHTQNFLPDLPRAESKIWDQKVSSASCSSPSTTSSGATVNCAVPVFSSDPSAGVVAAVVGQLKLDSVLSQAASLVEQTNSGSRSGPMVIVLDRFRRLLYHPNDSLKHQLVDSALPDFMPVAASMTRNESGNGRFTQPTGEEYIAAFRPLTRIDAAVAVARNRSTALQTAKRAGWIGIAVAFGLALPAAFVWDRFRQRQSRGIDRVAEGVTAIAKGELDRQIVVSSDDGTRIIADNINLMTERYRDQLAREAEVHQFESFVRLSAMLTHDLKNAIEALSLIVGNMEVHFDNKEFRADMMKSLTLATEKLKALVARISNPITTLSGEHKMPKPVDLVGVLRRVLAVVAEPVRAKYEIELKVPASMHALVDPERIDRVIENLVINAIEAMGERGGKLRVEIGTAGPDKVFLSVSDTGQGMSKEFIDHRLFRPFATTKRSGVGLGLYTCREVVRANAGTIDVESKQGVGTTFRVVLPSAEVEGRN